MGTRTGVFMPLLLTMVFQLLLDLYVYRGVKLLSPNMDPQGKAIVFYIYWIISGAVIAIGVYDSFTMRSAFNTGERLAFYNYTFALWLLFFVPKLVYALFLLVDDVTHLVRFLSFSSDSKSDAENGITRLQFINQAGVLAAAIPFISIAYGVLKGRFDYNVIKQDILSSVIPKNFNGFKIVQLSDIHLGSFYDNHEPMEEAIRKVNALEPDLILFTGDLVNNFGFETRGWEPVLSKLKAKHGKFSVLGNHDYGDYATSTMVPGSKERLENFKEITDFHKSIGFDLLMDENREISINGDSIRILGVQNWGAKGGLRKQYGDLKKALEGTNEKEFQVLLSHDPSHWEGQILDQSNIDLTLSGHTHGMQFGIKIPGFEWSLVKYIYKQWAGLYSKGDRHIYVNRGLGYVGFPGRVGILPEITLLTLKSTS